MLGFYDYTVVLTYLSLCFASTGILISMLGEGHPYFGVFFLMLCGLCDAFDGRVARTKKNRTKAEVSFGIQIDSLTDLVAFGVLPTCIGNAMLRTYDTIPRFVNMPQIRFSYRPVYFALLLIMLFYILAALIRLAYFNVTEEERQEKEGGCRKYYEGLPVTSASLIFPIILTLQYVLPQDFSFVYFVFLLLTGIAFVSKLKIPKPGLRGILLMIGVGVIDAIILFLYMFFIGA